MGSPGHSLASRAADALGLPSLAEFRGCSVQGWSMSYGSRDVAKELARLQEQKAQLEEDLVYVEKQIWKQEAQYLQDTLHTGNVVCGWDGYLGTRKSSGAIRRINRFR